ncbi:hypothetical protein TrVE_jg12071 [Triparma verrucosa]|uniref:indole-3-glycerol-phosphate synthase n=1 Tax=Triparma verrucosa TaxID=1606542 RepID=A0A9W7BK95_9STRA|nr:hypothetical protein TrVE_jg12071 [Triparma verrucosa]
MKTFHTTLAVLLVLLELCTSFLSFPSGSRNFRNSPPITLQSDQAAWPLRPLFAAPQEPIAFVSSLSADQELESALSEVTKSALSKLPAGTSAVSLAIISVSSSYDTQSSMAVVVPAIVAQAQAQGVTIENLIGSTAGGVIGGVSNQNGDEDTVECEGIPAVSLTLTSLPDVSVEAWHISESEVPDMEYAETYSEGDWLKYLKKLEPESEEEEEDPKNIYMIAGGNFQKFLDHFLKGVDLAFPSAVKFGSVASTVSSLSKARIYSYSHKNPDSLGIFNSGIVGVTMTGDITVKPMIAQGARVVGPTYKVVDGNDSIVRSIVLDETLGSESTIEKAKESDSELKRAEKKMAEDMSKLPKPVLAEVNMMVKRLDDDEQAFMKRALLIGVERNFDETTTVGNTVKEFESLATGKGHSYLVRQVASAGMRDGSVTMPKGSVDICPGMRLRFFVRDSEGAKEELAALWTGYKKIALEEAFEGKTMFRPAACLTLPTMDRGQKLFGDRPGSGGLESGIVTEYLGSRVSNSGCFNNGVFASLDPGVCSETSVFGSAGLHVVIGPKSDRHVWGSEGFEGSEQTADDSDPAPVSPSLKKVAAPRDEDGELVLKRREVQSGRAISVSTINWSVAGKEAVPTSQLEYFLWEKETEVDRLRERNPLANILSNCKAFMMNPENAKTLDWVGAIRKSSESGLATIPEFKRADPNIGSLRKRYLITQLADEFKEGGAAALSVNCDGVMFGGSPEDLENVREACPNLPLLASDLIIYPYQIYKLRMSGADAINLVAAASTPKDILYSAKIGKSLGLQVCVCVNSVAQFKKLENLDAGVIDAISCSNREWEDMSLDATGQRAIGILKSAELKTLREKHPDLVVLIEGGVSTEAYLDEVAEAGAEGVIIGSGLSSALALQAGRSIKRN